jgi:exodeoxyribonuclease-3
MPDYVKLVTWNVNSIRQRLERLIALLARHAPDVVCLQETKVVDADFPSEALRRRVRERAGQKAYNGGLLARPSRERSPLASATAMTSRRACSPRRSRTCA